MTRAASFFIALTGLLVGCASSVSWKNYVVLRSTGTALETAAYEDKEVATTKIETNLNYASVSLDAVFFRDLPGFDSADVAFGFEASGILGGGKILKTVLDAKRAQGSNAFLTFDNLVVIDPFLYRGENVALAFHFAAVPSTDAEVIRAQAKGIAGAAIKKFSPRNSDAIEAGLSFFSSVFGFRKKTWQYSFTMFPADRVYRDKPDLLFTAGRYILVAMPAADASAHLKKKYNVQTITRELKMRGNRLVRAATDEEFTDLPYIVLNITRYKRYPSEDTDLRKALKGVDIQIANRDYDLAKAQLRSVGALIVADPVITSTEKNLERSLVKWREHRIEALHARKQEEPEREYEQVGHEVDQLIFVLREFSKILEPFEVKDFLFRMKEGIRRGEELARQFGDDSHWVDAANLQLAKLVRANAEPPLATADASTAADDPTLGLPWQEIVHPKRSSSAQLVFPSGIRCVRPPEEIEARSRDEGSNAFSAAEIARSAMTFAAKTESLSRLPLSRAERHHALFLLCVDHANGLLSHAEYLHWRDSLKHKRDGESVTKAVVANPDAPLAVSLWTTKREYNAREKIEIRFKGNRDFHARLIYRDASGTLTQLLPNPFRADSRFRGGITHGVPAGADKFELEVAGPFGTESVLLYASEKPIGDVSLEAKGAVYGVREKSIGAVTRRSRGIVIKAKSASTPSTAPNAGPPRRDGTQASTSFVTRP